MKSIFVAIICLRFLIATSQPKIPSHYKKRTTLDLFLDTDFPTDLKANKEGTQSLTSVKPNLNTAILPEAKFKSLHECWDKVRDMFKGKNESKTTTPNARSESGSNYYTDISSTEGSWLPEVFLDPSYKVTTFNSSTEATPKEEEIPRVSEKQTSTTVQSTSIRVCDNKLYTDAPAWDLLKNIWTPVNKVSSTSSEGPSMSSTTPNFFLAQSSLSHSNQSQSKDSSSTNIPTTTFINVPYVDPPETESPDLIPNYNCPTQCNSVKINSTEDENKLMLRIQKVSNVVTQRPLLDVFMDMRMKYLRDGGELSAEEARKRVKMEFQTLLDIFGKHQNEYKQPDTKTTVRLPTEINLKVHQFEANYKAENPLKQEIVTKAQREKNLQGIIKKLKKEAEICKRIEALRKARRCQKMLEKEKQKHAKKRTEKHVRR